MVVSCQFCVNQCRIEGCTSLIDWHTATLLVQEFMLHVLHVLNVFHAQLNISKKKLLFIKPGLRHLPQ